MMKQKILIGDDEIHMCKSLCEILESESLDAIYSTRSSQALRLVAENDVDLIFLDIKMPEMNGIDLVKCIRAKDPGIPIIMITGYPSVNNIVQSMKLVPSRMRCRFERASSSWIPGTNRFPISSSWCSAFAVTGRRCRS
jgi:DNA-binding NtrC family response regulator